jgi:transcription termination/antitermination protein NusA
MLDIKTLQSVLGEFEERGIARETMTEAIESAMATAYKKEYGKRGQVIRAALSMETGTVAFEQIKMIVDPTLVRFLNTDEQKIEAPSRRNEYSDRYGDQEEIIDGELPRFDDEKHILIEDAKRIKRDSQLGDEIVFPLEPQDDFGRIAAQTAKQVVIQKIREAEKLSILEEFGHKKGEIVSGIVQRIERGAIFVDLGRATGIIPYEEQIPGERFRMGERIRAYLYNVDEGFRGVYLRLSRAHPKFLIKLFEAEVPELAAGSIEVKGLSREPGSRTKIAISSLDPHVDPVGSLVGQRGVRVSTVMGELRGERIDIIEWSADPALFIKESLSPASVIDVRITESDHRAVVVVSEDQQSLAIGRGGQNVRLAAKLTGWNIDIEAIGGEHVADADPLQNSAVTEPSEETILEHADEGALEIKEAQEEFSTDASVTEDNTLTVEEETSFGDNGSQAAAKDARDEASETSENNS